MEMNAKMPDGSGAMFDRIAHRYDLLNRIMSLGIDHRWRRLTLQKLADAQPARILDLATGTGDMALEAARQYPEAHIVGLDPSVQMLAVGEPKVAGLNGRIVLQEGDAQQLPFPDQSFDAVCMGFGIRNVPDRAKALREMVRVLRPGGRVSILELSEPPTGLIGFPARLYVHHMVPWMGAMISSAPEYRYLQQSIAAFPPASEFVSLMADQGLRDCKATALMFGVCHIYEGTVGGLS